MTATLPSPTAQGVEGYHSTTTFQSSPGAVFDALTCADAVTQWWAPTTGSGLNGGELSILFGDQEARMRVDRAEHGAQVTWTVLACEPVPDWEATTITFDLEPAGNGAVLHFTHHGLTPQLECFSMCRAGWTQYLAGLADYVDRDGGNPFGSATDERAAAWREHRARDAG